MNKMVVANLVNRPLRSLISIFAVGVEVTLILLIVGLSVGILNDTRERQKGIGADVMVRPPASSNFSGLTGSPMSVKVADIVKKLPHVREVSPVITHFNTNKALEVMYGIDYASFNNLGNHFRFLEGGPFTGPHDMIVDDYYARANNAKVGDKVEALNTTFTISGIVENGRGARRFMPLKTVQELSGAEGKVSILYVSADDPKNADVVAQEVVQVPGMNTYNVLTLQSYLSLMSLQNVPGLSVFINVIIGVAVCIGFLVIFQSMYTAVMERTREIGILKSMGASKMYIANVIVRETMLLTVFGILIGVLMTVAARQAIIGAFPTLRMEMPWNWTGYAAVISIIGAFFGSLYPAVKAARRDPIDALAYE